MLAGAGVAEEWFCRDSICGTPEGDGCSAAEGGELLVVALAVSVGMKWWSHSFLGLGLGVQLVRFVLAVRVVNIVVV